MDRSLFRFILRHSKRQQLILLGAIVLTYPINLLQYELPKQIIDRAIGGSGPPFSATFFGVNFTTAVDQVAFLVMLCLGFLAVVVASNALKYFINVFKGTLAEQLLRRLRYQLFTHVLRFPLPHFKKVSQGELISMMTGEAEQVGAFTAGAIADPAFLGGQLAMAILFILLQDPLLGAAALVLYPVQIVIIPRLQKRVSQLAKARLREVRRLSEHIGESVASIVDVHANDASNYEQSRFTHRLGVVYDIRRELFVRKYDIKFINNFIDKLAPFFFYLIGGILVLQGNITIGALVAVIGAHKEMAAPWKELLTWYQQREDAKAKYDQIVTQFDPPGMLDEEQLQRAPDVEGALEGTLAFRNVTLVDDDDVRRLTNVAFETPLSGHVALVGAGNSGKEYAAQLAARLGTPTRGNISIAGHNMAELAESVTGRRLGYVGANVFLQSSSVRDNLLYGLKHRPVRPAELSAEEAAKREADLRAAVAAGNIGFDFGANWVDVAAAGVADEQALAAEVTRMLGLVGLADDVYQLGLRSMIDARKRPEIAESILEARKALRDRLEEDENAALVEGFDRGHYNTNATLAENLLFGNLVGDGFETAHLAEHPYLLQVLKKAGLHEELLDVGRQVAATMVEIFADLPAGHEFFELYSFISSDDLPAYQALLSRADGKQADALSDEDQALLLALPLQLVPSQHRLGLLEQDLQERLIAARQMFADDLPDNLKGAVEFFDPEGYNSAASLQDNILFGKIAGGQARAAETVAALIAEVLESRGLRSAVMEAGLDFRVGVGGSRLSSVQRQKLAIARALLKQSDMLIMDEAGIVLDRQGQSHMVEAVLTERAGKGVLWALSNPALAERFGHIVVMLDGRVVEQGDFATLKEKQGAFAQLLERG